MKTNVRILPVWGIVLLVLFSLQCVVWIWMYKSIRKRTALFWHDNLPLLDVVFLSDLKTCSNNNNNKNTKQYQYDSRKCSSPECGLTWPLGSCRNMNGTVTTTTGGRSWTSSRTCGWCDDSSSSPPLARYLQTLADQLQDKHMKECMNQIVVYSVALGYDYERFLWDVPQPFNATAQYGTKLIGADVIRRHGNCFFTFVLQNSTGTSVTTPTLITDTRTTDGIDWVIAIPANVLPYRNHRRNTKLIKLQGHLIFPWAQKLIWQDTKFRRQDFSHTRPADYHRWFDDHVHGVCAGFYNLPSHENSFGKYARAENYQNNYIHHCETVVEALKIRHTVTDSMASLLHQCREYVQDQKGHFESELLSIAMIDSAFMAWDLREAHCRTFVADLTCTWLDEIHCYSDRDQISFPHVIRSMKLHPLKRGYVDPVNTNIEFWSKDRPIARFTKSRCHWYFQELDECYPK